MKLNGLLKNAWLKGWVLLVPLALLASLMDALLLGGVRTFLAFLTGSWPESWPRIPLEGELWVAVWAGAMSLILVLRWVALVVRSRFGERMARTLEANLKGWWIRVVRGLHPKHFHTSEILGALRSADQATSILPAGSEAAIQAIQAFFQLLLFLPVLFWISWPLALALLLGLVPWVTWLQRRIQAIGPDLDAHMQRSGEYEADLENWSLLQRCWIGWREQSKYLHVLLEEVRELKRLGVQAGTRKAFLGQSMESLSVFATVIVLGLCALLIGRGDMTPADLVLFCSALFICYKPLKECARLAPHLRDMESAYMSLRKLDKLDRSESIFTYSPDDRVRIAGLQFSYQNSDSIVFSGMDREFSLEKPLLLKGTNGAGKTTLLRLLAGLELPDSGTIEMPAKARNGVFFLSQRLLLPPVQWLAEQVAQGTWGEATERLFTVLELRRLLGKKGHSGGELQRLGLGWAIVSRSPLLFLDEPMAFVAQGLRTEIFQALWDATAETGQWWMMASHETPPADYLSRMVVWELGA